MPGDHADGPTGAGTPHHAAVELAGTLAGATELTQHWTGVGEIYALAYERRSAAPRAAFVGCIAVLDTAA